MLFALPNTCVRWRRLVRRDGLRPTHGDYKDRWRNAAVIFPSLQVAFDGKTVTGP